MMYFARRAALVLFALVLLFVGLCAMPLKARQDFAIAVFAQVGCSPNPNVTNGPGHFVNGCNVPASALNWLTGNGFMSAISIVANAPSVAAVPSFGALCGASDSTTILQSAMTYISTLAPGGKILIACPITIAGGVTMGNSTRLTGVGPIYYPGMLDVDASNHYISPIWPPLSGPAINCTGTSSPCISVAGQGDEIDHLNLGNAQPAPPVSGTYTPIAYPYIVATDGTTMWNGLHLDKLSFTGAYQCIDLEGTPDYSTYGIAGAQWTITDVWFNPCLAVGIRIHNVDNTGRISNIDYDFWWNRHNVTVGKYVELNSVGVDCEYCANTQFDNIEFLYNKTAFQFVNSTVTYTNSPLVVKTLAAYNIQLSNIDFNEVCEGFTIPGGNGTVVNGQMTNVIAAEDATYCTPGAAFWDLSSDNADFTMSNVEAYGLQTVAAIGHGTGGNLKLSQINVTGYSAFSGGAPAFKVSAGAHFLLSGTDYAAIVPSAGAGLLEGLGVDGTQGYLQPLCVSGGSKPKEGAACLAGGAAGGNITGSVNFYDTTPTFQGYIGAATSTGINIKSFNGKVLLELTNGASSAISTFGADTSNHNLINVNPLPTSPPSGTGLAGVICVDNAGNLYFKNPVPCP